MPENAVEDNISIKRKKLIFRSWHRGTREIDLLLGRFADAVLPSCDADMLALYDAFLNNNDPDIYNWITRAETVPEEENTAIVQRLLEFYPQ
jgi:antitoxin CptB